MTTTKIDIYNSEKVFEKTLKKFRQNKKISLDNKNYVINFLKDASIGKASSIKKRGKNLGVRGRLKLLFSLKISCEHFQNKDFKKLTNKDMEKYVIDLDSNIIRKTDGHEYSSASKSSIKKSLIRLLRWLYGEDSQKYIKMTRWIDTSCKSKTMKELSEDNIKQLLSKCNTIKQKMIICCLFDGGFRIEEFLNIRNSDVKLVNNKVPYYQIEAREEFSKTDGRIVRMYWSNSYDIIKEWIDSKDTNLGEEDQFFVSTYDGVRKILNKLGERVDKKIHPHLFRHSSATYYASRLNRQQLCVRYGWKFSSDMPDIYIARAGVDDKEQIEKYESTKFEDLKEKLKKQQEESRFKNDEIEKIKIILGEVVKQLALEKRNPVAVTEKGFNILEYSK